MLNKKRFFAILFLIVLLGGFLRSYKLGEVSFVADEFLDVSASYGYFKTGIWHAWDFNLGQPAERINDPSDARAWIYRWQIAQLFKFFPPTEATTRAVSVLWGMLSIVSIGLLATSFTKKRVIGLLSAALFAISISGILMDRHVRMYAMFFPVFLLFSWSIFKFWESGYECKIALLKKINTRLDINLLYLVPVIFFGWLSFELHQLSANIAIIFLVYVTIQAIWLYLEKRSLINKNSVALLTAIAVFVLAQIFAHSAITNALGTLKFFTNHPSYLNIIWRDYNNVFIATGFLFAGVYYLIKTRLLRNESIWLAVSFFAPLLAAIFLWKRNVGEQYIFFIQSFEIILIASGVYAVAIFFQDNLSRYKKKSFYIALIISFLVLPNYTYFLEENNTYAQTSKSENPNYRSVFAYFKKNKKATDVLITRDFRNYYWSGEKVRTFDFGGELSKQKFSLDELQKIISENPSGWFIYSDNDEDYISEAAQNYVEKNLEKLNTIAVRGSISVYRWNN